MRLKIQHCINKARDMQPTLDSHSPAEVVKGSSAPAYTNSRCKQNDSDVYSPYMSEHVHAQQNTHITCMYACVAPVLP